MTKLVKQMLLLRKPPQQQRRSGAPPGTAAAARGSRTTSNGPQLPGKALLAAACVVVAVGVALHQWSQHAAIGRHTGGDPLARQHDAEGAGPLACGDPDVGEHSTAQHAGDLSCRVVLLVASVRLAASRRSS